MTGNSLPTGAALGREVVRRDFSWFGHTEQAWSRTRFLVPNGWRNISQRVDAPDSQALVTLAAFVAPKADASVRLQAIRLAREISAELWLRHYLIVTENRPVTLLPVSGLFADSLSEFKMDDDRVCARIAVRVHGPLLFLMAATCRVDRYAEFAETFGVCVASFRPDSAPESPTIEPRSRARLADTLAFEYPSSWSLREHAAPGGKHAIDLTYLQDGQPSGLIRIKLAPKTGGTDASQQRSDTLQEFSWAAIQCGDLIATANALNVSQRFLSGQMHVYQAQTAAGLPQELWVATLEEAAHWVTLSMLTPAREAEFLVWACNRTALTLVSESLN